MPRLKTITGHRLTTIRETQNISVTRSILRQPLTGQRIAVTLLQAATLRRSKINRQTRLMLRIAGTRRQLVRHLLTVHRNPILIGLLLHRIRTIRARNKQSHAIGSGRINHRIRRLRRLSTQLMTVELHQVTRLPILLRKGAHLIHEATQRVRLRLNTGLSKSQRGRRGARRSRSTCRGAGSRSNRGGRGRRSRRNGRGTRRSRRSRRRLRSRSARCRR